MEATSRGAGTRMLLASLSDRNQHIYIYIYTCVDGPIVTTTSINLLGKCLGEELVYMGHVGELQRNEGVGGSVG